ncbi:cellulose synthase-like protein H1 [Telopea speciosissima]|uniref:cellulose synthase-like protein H1 n=1 Tax=Telopea speciosissima TaxID=54955 RepID=UPI001CC53B4A|nr:cellulose synthase-like protein H1 [Telopea speciosissima]
MANPISSIPLQERIPGRNTLQRVLDLIIFFLLLLFLFYLLLSFNVHGVAWKLAFFCESWFTFCWILTMNARWTPVDYTTYPERLLQWAGDELPPVDMFVTTTDAVLEPPIITVNTVLSLLAVDYPAHKLACYVSDDGASPLTFYSLVEAAKFAKLWVPFCKRYEVQARAPFMYFSTEPTKTNSHFSSSDFQREWKKIKTRVSGVMTNSPFMFNVDCDMFANNPKIVLMAMCHVLGFEKESESGFVLYPQKFYGISKDD